MARKILIKYMKFLGRTLVMIMMVLINIAIKKKKYQSWDGEKKDDRSVRQKDAGVNLIRGMCRSKKRWKKS